MRGARRVRTRLTSAGDPTDTSIKLRPLEPASGQALARDLVLKTRRRKGLGDQIAVSKYLDDEFVVRVHAGRWLGVLMGGTVGTVGVWACRFAGIESVEICIWGWTLVGEYKAHTWQAVSYLDDRVF